MKVRQICCLLGLQITQTIQVYKNRMKSKEKNKQNKQNKMILKLCQLFFHFKQIPKMKHNPIIRLNQHKTQKNKPMAL